jgi:muramoyltetrapeptide carboxypeptidase
MAHIYIFSPSSAVRDKASFRRGVKLLQSQGHEVEVDAAALASHLRFAGDDEARLAAIARAAASGADVALISRGGYGLTRILAGINYKAVAKAVQRGTQFVGISDFTAFQLALLAKTGTISWAGPALGDFGVEDGKLDEIMLDCFNDLLLGQGEGTGWRLPIVKKTAIDSIASPADVSGISTQLSIKNAVLWGGNLCVLTSLLGTPYWPAVERGVLFLEDVGEHPYRIERMLTQLLHAGVLAKQKAVVLGQFNNYKLVPAHDKGYQFQTVVNWLRSQLKVPVLTGLPYGHVPTKVLLPVGAKVSLITESRDALLLWGDLS